MTLIHPQMLDALEAVGFFPASCDIQAREAGVDAHGVPNGAWANVAGLAGLACSVNTSPYMGGALSRQEVKLSDQTVTTGIVRIVLAGHYGGITTSHRAVVGGTVYDIAAVNSDAQGALTELLVQEVTT